MAGLYARDVVATPEIKRHEIIGPWLTEANLVLLYGPRGSGKSNLALGIAHAAATGTSYLRPSWTPWKPNRVLYLDSELGIQAWRRKLNEVDSASIKSLTGESLNFITPECMESISGRLWNISNPDDQELIWNEALTFDLIIFDNLIDFSSKLHRADYDLDIWHRTETFLKHLRNAGKSVVVVHHAGKSGDQLGTIEHEKPMDTVVKLQPVHCPEFQGMKCDLHFTKARWFFGGSLEPLRVEYERLLDGSQRWRAVTLSEAQREWAILKKKIGWSEKDISKYLQVSDSQLKEILGDFGSPFYGAQHGTGTSEEDYL